MNLELFRGCNIITNVPGITEAPAMVSFRTEAEQRLFFIAAQLTGLDVSPMDVSHPEDPSCPVVYVVLIHTPLPYDELEKMGIKIIDLSAEETVH